MKKLINKYIDWRCRNMTPQKKSEYLYRRGRGYTYPDGRTPQDIVDEIINKMGI